MKVLQIGNVGVGSSPHSTENELHRGMSALGWDIEAHHERTVDWRAVPLDVDFILWTHTHGFAPENTHRAQTALLWRATRAHVPIVAYHLDLWWGLDREPQLHDEPFFRCDRVCTADGGHDDLWDDFGIEHRWFPPAVSAAECVGGTAQPEYASDIAFVGSWQGGYHAESSHRHALIGWLQGHYDGRCGFWPPRNEPAVRGHDLRDLMASVKVVVGDSCMVPTLRRYWSDRVPETLGRGALLVHPDVDGLLDKHPHVITWEAGDWDALAELVDEWTDDDGARREWTERARTHTLAHHTYTVRMQELADMLTLEGLLT